MLIICKGKNKKYIYSLIKKEYIQKMDDPFFRIVVEEYKKTGDLSDPQRNKIAATTFSRILRNDLNVK